MLTSQCTLAKDTGLTLLLVKTTFAWLQICMRKHAQPLVLGDMDKNSYPGIFWLSHNISSIFQYFIVQNIQFNLKSKACVIVYYNRLSSKFLIVFLDLSNDNWIKECHYYVNKKNKCILKLFKNKLLLSAQVCNINEITAIHWNN